MHRLHKSSDKGRFRRGATGDFDKFTALGQRQLDLL
jgi:hypothetical protein